MPGSVGGDLAFLADTLERLGVGLLVNELPCVGITLGPPLVLGVVGLTAVTDGAIAVSVTFGRVGCHGLHFSVKIEFT